MGWEQMCEFFVLKSKPGENICELRHFKYFLLRQ
jgi:hypothetical protein